MSKRKRGRKINFAEKANIFRKELEDLQNKSKELNKARILDIVNKTNISQNPDWGKRSKLKKAKNSQKNKKRKWNKQVKSKIYNSRGEQEVSNALVRLNLKFTREHKFQDCINPLTGQHLIFDFYLADYKTCIEFDGRQHFEYVKDFYGEDPIEGARKLAYQKRKDEIKNEYCKRKCLNLIRISYKDYPNIQTILTNWFKN